MTRRALELGEHGEVSAVPQRRDPATGKWAKAPLIRQAERWRARCYLRGNDGIRREIVGYGKRKADAIASVDRQLTERSGIDTDARLTAGSPLATAGALWLERCKRSDSGLSAKTVELYEGTWTRHVVGDGSPVRGLTLSQANDPQRIRGLLERVADGHGTATAKTTRSVLSSVLQHAVDVGILPHNATRSVRAVAAQHNSAAGTRGRRHGDHDRAFTRAQRDAVVRHADLLAGLAEATEGEDSAPPADARTMRKRVATADLVAVLAGTGVRISEARAIRWEDVDLDAATVVIRGTKTAGSLRTLSLPGWLVERLRRRAEKSTTGYVLPSPGLTDPEAAWDEHNSNAAVRKVLDGAGFSWAVSHSFRRTVASELHRQGAPLVRIADQLGHKDPTMTASVYLGRDLAGDKADLAALL